MEYLQQFFLQNPQLAKARHNNNFIYCRVSNTAHDDDLQRQVTYLHSKYPTYQLITDIASGLNFKRPGLQTILEHAMSDSLGEVVVAHKDRLCRFGYELIEFIINKGGGKITIDSTEDTQSKSYNEELASDLLNIITIFNARQLGRRCYQKCQNTHSCKCQDSSETKGVDGRGAVCLQQSS